MTNTPGDRQPPQDPSGGQPGQQPYGQPQQPYGAAGYPAQAPAQYAPDHPQATTSLVLGVLGVVLCGIIAPLAWAMGRKAVAEIDASNGTIGGRGAASAGYVLGIVGTIILGLSVLVVVVVLGIVALGTMASAGH